MGYKTRIVHESACWSCRNPGQIQIIVNPNSCLSLLPKAGTCCLALVDFFPATASSTAATTGHDVRTALIAREKRQKKRVTLKMKTEITILTFEQNLQFHGSTKKTRMIKIWRDTKRRLLLRRYLKSLAQPFKIFAPENAHARVVTKLL